MTLISTPANPVPEGAVTGVLKTPDGVALRFARWAPPSGRKGTLLVLPGRTEFIEKYFEVVSEARARGFAVGMIDWRGQGLSERALRDPLKGHVGNFGEYDLDLETFVREIVLPDCPPPLFALGHSMGAAMLLRAAQKGRRWFDRVVLCAPMIALAGRAGTRFASVTARTLRLVGLGGSYVPGGGAKPVAALPFIGNMLSSDPVRYARTAAIVEAEPMLGLGSPTVAWLDAAYRAMGRFADPQYPERIRQPILIVAAGQDEIVSTPITGRFAARLRVGSHLVIAGARHEILMEQDRYRMQFWAAFDAFVPGTPLFG
jgi:lysophospholipase